MDINISDKTKETILNQKLIYWKSQLYSLELDAKVAQTVDDKQMLENVKAQLKTAIAAIEILEKELDGLNAI